MSSTTNIPNFPGSECGQTSSAHFFIQQPRTHIQFEMIFLQAAVEQIVAPPVQIPLFILWTTSSSSQRSNIGSCQNGNVNCFWSIWVPRPPPSIHPHGLHVHTRPSRPPHQSTSDIPPALPVHRIMGGGRGMCIHLLGPMGSMYGFSYKRDRVTGGPQL